MRSRSRAERRGPRAGDRGTVTAEFAVALPAIVLVLAACLSALQLAGLQLRLTDAATAAVRQLARGDPVAARALATRLVPGSTVSVGSRGDLACVTLVARVGGVLAALPVTAQACALREGG